MASLTVNDGTRGIWGGDEAHEKRSSLNLNFLAGIAEYFGDNNG